MNVFISYHYDDDNKWVEELIRPFVEAFEFKVITGRLLPGEYIAPGVLNKSRQCDLIIGFVTKPWQTNPWVRDELVNAAGTIPVVPFIDIQLPRDLGGPLQGIQTFPFDSGRKELMLLQLAQILIARKQALSVKRLLILPPGILKKAQSFLRANTLSCRYRYRDGFHESSEYETKPFKLANGLAVDIQHIPSEQAYIQMSLSAPDFYWSCGYSPINLISVTLDKELV